MGCVLGIDLGTSGLKVMLLDEESDVIAAASRQYMVDIPQEGFAEQEPDVWWKAFVDITVELREQWPDKWKEIRGIGFSGQMHGLVPLARNGRPLRPAILWMDQRSCDISARVEQRLGIVRMGEVLHNRVFSGFAFPSLLWMREYEPENFENMYKFVMPKDYLRFRLTGEIGTDASDASSACILDERTREWAWEIIREFELPRDIFPEVHEAQDIAGEVTGSAGEETGLAPGIPVVYGCGDQPAQSIGNGAVEEGMLICNIGTGGQISTYSDRDRYDHQLRVHTFCHGVNRAYTIFGAALCSGMSMNWLGNQILHEQNFAEMGKSAESTEPGSRGLIYLPYLTGERTPHMNPRAKGMFFGLQLCHDRRHMIRSVMEGVVYSLKDSLEIFREMGLDGSQITASGGGAASRVWLQIQADILERPVRVCQVREQACLGAGIVAGVGVGIYRNVEEAVRKHVVLKEESIDPRPEYQEMYREQYETFRQLYLRNRDLM